MSHSQGMSHRIKIRDWFKLFAVPIVLLLLSLAVVIIMYSMQVTRSPSAIIGSMGLVSRAVTTALAAIVMAIAIAVPLTANIYTPRLIESFITDKVSMWVLGFLVITNIYVCWAAYFSDGTVATILISHILTTICLLMLIPYFFHIFRLLHPINIKTHVLKDAISLIRKSTRDNIGLRRARKSLFARIEQLSNITVKSIERADREIALEYVWSFYEILNTYSHEKKRLRDVWFLVDQDVFMVLSDEARQEIADNRTMVEAKCLKQLDLIYNSAIPNMRDVVIACARISRMVSTRAASVGDVHVVRLCIEFFNTFIREGLNKRDTKSIYIVLYHYRLMAEELLNFYPDLIEDISRYFMYYADVSIQMSMPGVVEIVANDLARLNQAAYDKRISNIDKLLATFMELLDRFCAEDVPADAIVSVRKTQAILASYYLLKGAQQFANLIAERMKCGPVEQLSRAESELLNVREKKFWEITDRRTNFYYVDEKQRELLKEFFAGLNK